MGGGDVVSRKGNSCDRALWWQGRMREAERYLSRALEEARLGFGEKDAHVASACNNLVGAGATSETLRVSSPAPASPSKYGKTTQTRLCFADVCL